MSMSSSRPYLVRALYDWIIDNDCTPYLLVNAIHEEVSVPQDHVNPDGQIVLNISPTAVSQFVMDGKCLSFSARFSGVPTDIYVPYKAVMGIYAKENQQGMIFDPEPDDLPEPPAPPKSNNKSRPSLKVVK